MRFDAERRTITYGIGIWLFYDWNNGIYTT